MTPPLADSFLGPLAQERSFLIGAAVAVAAALLLAARRPRPWAERLLFAAAALWVVARFANRLRQGDPPWDFEVFHTAGRAVLAGENPYESRYFLNPPTSLPLYALFALLPLATAGRVWQALNLVFLLLLGVLGGRIARRDGFPWAATAAVLASLAAGWGLDAGQVAVWTALLLYVAVWARDAPLAAGPSLALSTIKVATMIPFLPLFLRRRDVLTLAVMSAAGVLLVLVCTPPAELFHRLGQNLANMQGLARPGDYNDYSFAGLFHEDIVSLDRFFYCLGLRDRTLIGRLNLAALAALLGFFLVEILRRRLDPETPLAVSLACVLGCLFLYHRLYDTVILLVPLLYAGERARQTAGWRRAGYVASLAALLLAMNLPQKPMRALADWAESAGAAGYAVQAIVLPGAVWALLFALAFLWLSGRQRDAERRTDAAPLA